MGNNTSKFFSYTLTILAVIFLGLVAVTIIFFFIDKFSGTYYLTGITKIGSEFTTLMLVIFSIVVLIIIFLLSRQFLLWFWKIDDVIRKLTDIHEELKKISVMKQHIDCNPGERK
jgi:hypothetical protein